MENLKILIIDDNITKLSPIYVHLKLCFKDAEIVLKTKASEGLDYVLDNLNSKIIVLLDYDLGRGELNGTEILTKIREKSSLVYIIIVTAKMVESIPPKDLMTYINKDAMAFADKTISLEAKVQLVKNAIHSLDVRVDCMLEQWILNNSEDVLNEPFLTTTSGNKFTLKDILTEIRQRTDFGLKMERNIMLLAIDLLTRNKKQIGND